jgi:hypothetical protein
MVAGYAGPLHIAHGYGVFRTITGTGILYTGLRRMA